MIPERFEYIFILMIFALTGLSLSWEALRQLPRRASTVITLSLFFLYCGAIEVVALKLEWWSFPTRKVVGLYVWVIPVEELLLFLTFSTITLACWRGLRNETN